MNRYESIENDLELYRADLAETNKEIFRLGTLKVFVSPHVIWELEEKAKSITHTLEYLTRWRSTICAELETRYGQDIHDEIQRVIPGINQKTQVIYVPRINWTHALLPDFTAYNVSETTLVREERINAQLRAFVSVKLNDIIGYFDYNEKHDILFVLNERA